MRRSHLFPLLAIAAMAPVPSALAQGQPNQSDLMFVSQRAVGGDYNGDGIGDVAIVDADAMHVTLGIGLPDGRYAWEPPQPVAGTHNVIVKGKKILQNLTGAEAADLDGDGDDDLALALGRDNRILILRGDPLASRALVAADAYRVEAGPSGIAAADVDGRTGGLELISPLVALDEPVPGSFSPNAGGGTPAVRKYSNITLKRGVISSEQALDFGDNFGVLAPAAGGAKAKQRPELDHVGAYNFTVEVGGVTESRLFVFQLDLLSEPVEATYAEPYRHLVAADMQGAAEPGQFVLWGGGLDTFTIATASEESATGEIAIESVEIAAEGITLVEEIGGSDGLDKIAVVHGGGTQITVYGWDPAKKEFTARPAETPAGGVVQGIGKTVGSVGGGMFALMGDGSYAALQFDGAGDLQLAQQGALPPLAALAPHATIMLYTDDPLGGSAFEFESFAAGQWATGATYAGGNIDAFRETFGGSSAGLGGSVAIQLTPSADPGPDAQAQANQFGDASSSLFFEGGAQADGDAAVQISPPPGEYSSVQHIAFLPAEAGTSVIYRVNGQAWQQALAGGFFIAADSLVEFYGLGGGGATGSVQSAFYEIGLAFAMDSNGDLVPDEIAAFLGIDPSGNGDADGDGVSDGEEILNGSDPLSANSTPDAIAFALPPKADIAVAVNIPAAGGGVQDAPAPSASYTLFLGDGTPVRAEVAVRNGDGAIRDFSWTQVSGPFKWRTQSPFADTLVAEVDLPGTDPAALGASMLGMAFPAKAMLPPLPKAPSPGGPIPIPYPTIGSVDQWVEDTRTIIGGFKSVAGMDSQTEAVEINADTTLAVAAFTAWMNAALDQLGRVKVKFPWVHGGGNAAASDADFAILSTPQDPDLIAFELTHTAQQMYGEIAGNPAYLPLRVTAREMIGADAGAPVIVGRVYNAAEAIVRFFESGEIDGFYAGRVSQSVPVLQALRAQLLGLPMPADVRDIIGALVKLDAETWGIVTPGGETFALVQRGSVAVPVPGDGSVRLVRIPASPSEYASGIAFLPGATVHAVGFAVEGGGEKAGGDATELELVSLDLMAFDLGGGVVDTDGDTMDDAFEEHFLNGLGASFWDDSDGDGFSDGEEYLALTNPADPGSFPPGMPALPRNLTVAAEGGNIVLRWDGSAAAAYTVEFGDLLGWDPSPQAPIQSAPGRFEWSGPLPTGSQFFRVATNLQ